jgi:hypothetical protein
MKPGVGDLRSATSRRHPLSAMLGLIALGLLMGACDVLDIWRKVACLSQRQREALGLRGRDKQSRRLTMPGYDALNDLLGAMDPAAYARALTAYLQAHEGSLPRSLALDGKSLGNGRCGMIITLCRHEDGRPVDSSSKPGPFYELASQTPWELVTDGLMFRQKAANQLDSFLFQSWKPMHTVGLFSNGGFTTATHECFVKIISRFWISVFEPTPRLAEHARRLVGIIGH